MVSLNPNTPEESDPTAMAVPGNGSFSSSTAAAAAAVSTTSSTDDPAARVRKPYTITKSRESWTEPEHDKFMEAIQLFDRDWRKIEAFIGSKSAIQIRSHAQKYFLKAQKSGTGEHIPPPRPKRKAARPYPQKASKIDPVVSQVGGSFQTSPVLSEPEITRSSDSSPVPWSRTAAAAVSSGSAGTVQAVNSTHATKADGKMETTAQKWSTGNPTGQVNHGSTLKVLPDFAEVYNFIGSVFDPDASDHLRKLKKMDPIDVETVLLLVRNLSINLTSPHFEEHRRLLSSYEVDDDYSCGLKKQIQDNQPADNSGLGHFG